MAIFLGRELLSCPRIIDNREAFLAGSDFGLNSVAIDRFKPLL